MAQKEMTVKFSVTDMPETIWMLRTAMANILRNVAGGEAPRVAQRLREVAAAFEAGVDDGR